MRRTLSGFAGLVLLTGVLSAAPTQAATHVYVQIGPPPVVVEHRPPAPAGYYVWRPGYYRWTGARYTWVNGGWVRPPHRNAHWSAGSWRHEHRGYYWVPGHWATR